MAKGKSFDGGRNPVEAVGGTREAPSVGAAKGRNLAVKLVAFLEDLLLHGWTWEWLLKFPS